MLTSIFIPLGLAIDSFTIAIAAGISTEKNKLYNALKLASFFGIFQAVMPILGWFAGISLRTFITKVDHWVAFIILGLIGLKMIYGSIKKHGRQEKITLNNNTLLILSLATSIDALIVGLGVAFLGISIFLLIITAGIVTFTLSLLGFFIGKKLTKFLQNKIGIVGGLIFIIIGTKILLEHLI